MKMVVRSALDIQHGIWVFTATYEKNKKVYTTLPGVGLFQNESTEFFMSLQKLLKTFVSRYFRNLVTKDEVGTIYLEENHKLENNVFVPR